VDDDTNIDDDKDDEEDDDKDNDEDNDEEEDEDNDEEEGKDNDEEEDEDNDEEEDEDNCGVVRGDYGEKFLEEWYGTFEGADDVVAIPAPSTPSRSIYFESPSTEERTGNAQIIDSPGYQYPGGLRQMYALAMEDSGDCWLKKESLS